MNKTMTFELYRKMQMDNLVSAYSSAVWAGIMGKPVLYMGKEVHELEDGYLLFEKCDYCGSRETPQKGLYGGLYCVSCTAPITGEQ